MIQFSAGLTYPIIVSEPGKTLTLSNVTLTDSAGTVTAETVSDQTLMIAFPSNAALGAAVVNYDVNDGSGAVAATPIAVTIVAPPSAPVPGAQLVLVGGKYQLIQPNGVTFGASPTLTLTNASVGVVFGPAQVDNGSATDLPTWTLTGTPVGVYAATVSGLISGSSQTLTETVQVVSSLIATTVEYAFGPVYSNIDAQNIAISASGSECLYAQVSATQSATGAIADPTGASAYIALTDGAEPLDADWQTATWLTRTVGGAVTYWAQLPVSANALASGANAVWGRVSDGSQDARGRAGIILVD